MNDVIFSPAQPYHELFIGFWVTAVYLALAVLLIVAKRGVGRTVAYWVLVFGFGHALAVSSLVTFLITNSDLLTAIQQVAGVTVKTVAMVGGVMAIVDALGRVNATLNKR